MATVRELRDLAEDDLVLRLDSSKEELFNLRFQLATGQLDNPMRIKEVRHEIARIFTILRERELEEAAERKGVRSQAVAPPLGEDGSSGEAEAAPAKRRRLRRARQEEVES